MYLKGFFDPTLSQVRVHAEVLRVLVARYFPKVSAMLEKHEIEPLTYCTPWFMSMYTTILPWPSVLRIWDVLFAEGNLILLKVGLAIFRELEGSLSGLPCFCGGVLIPK